MPLTRPIFALVLLLLGVHSTSSAGELSTVFNGKSFHLGASQDWNEENLGLGLEYQFDTQTRWKSVIMANGFRDSDNNMSYMAGGGVHRNLFQSNAFNGLFVDLGVNVFLMTRQDVNDGRPFPGILPSLSVGNRQMGFNLTYLPESAVEQMTSSRMLDQSIRGIVFVQFKLNVSQFFTD